MVSSLASFSLRPRMVFGAAGLSRNSVLLSLSLRNGFALKSSPRLPANFLSPCGARGVRGLSESNLFSPDFVRGVYGLSESDLFSPEPARGFPVPKLFSLNVVRGERGLSEPDLLSPPSRSPRSLLYSRFGLLSPSAGRPEYGLLRCDEYGRFSPPSLSVLFK